MRWARAAVTVLVAAVSGCTMLNAQHDLERMGWQTGGQWVPVRRADFPSGDPREGTRGAPGSQMLAAAVAANEYVGEIVARHGIPDAIAATPDASRAVYLAYLADRRVYTVAIEGFWMKDWVVREDALSEEDLTLVDPERRATAQAEALRDLIAAHARVQTIGRALVQVVPPAAPAGASYGFLLLNATPTTVKLYGGEPSEQEKIVAWVDPNGPQRDRLRVGDRVTAVNGVSPRVGDASGARWEGAKKVSIRRAGESLEVAIEPEAWPRAVMFVVIPAEAPNALAVDGQVGVTTGFLELFPDDDALAVAMGHELAHLTLGHVERKVTAGSVLKGIVGVGVLLPANIVLPGSGQLLGAGIQGVENRFNRDQERDADRVGLQYVKTAGYDPAAALVLIDTLQEKAPVGGVDQFLDIHPPYPERRTLIAAELERLR